MWNSSCFRFECGRFYHLRTAYCIISELPSSCTASLNVVSSHLLLRSLGTTGFRDVTETSHLCDVIEINLELMTTHTESERGLVTGQILEEGQSCKD